MKTCSVCKIDKELSEFSKRELKGDGYSAHCRICANSFVKDWKLRNSVKYKLNYQTRHIERMKTDIQYKLKQRLRQRLLVALKGNYKAGSAVDDLGCSIQFLKTYLEMKFAEGMTWSNYGRHGWHIDHIRPLAEFDLTDPEQFKQACHYSNLQPLWSSDNLRKGARSVVK